MAIQESFDTGAARPEKSRGEAYEGIAFTFCKAATVLLLLRLVLRPEFHLPAVAGAATLFYLLAYYHGQRSSRCVLRKPLLIAGFWGFISALTLYAALAPRLLLGLP